jgi:hypothetical protein
MVSGDPEANHSTKRVSEKHGGSFHPMFEKRDDVGGVFFSAITLGDVGGTAVTAEVWREEMPIFAKRWDQRFKNLPAPSQAVDQNERRTILRAFKIVEADLPGIENVLFEAKVLIDERQVQCAAPES